MKSAKLYLYCYKDKLQKKSSDINVYPLVHDWKEDDCSWLNYDKENKWKTPGGDMKKSVVTTKKATKETNAVNAWEEYDITSIVRKWGIVPSINNGLILSFTGNGHRLYHSSEYVEDPALRPKLVITYSSSTDTAAPITSGINVTPKETSAYIEWVTNEDGLCELEYGPTTNYGTNIPLSDISVVHSVKIPAGLAPNTTYNYRIKSKDLSGNIAATDNFTFTTPAWNYSGFKGEYFNNASFFDEPVAVREDSKIDFEWDENIPDAKITSDNFSVRWTKVDKFGNGTYMFSIHTENQKKLRLFVDSSEVQLLTPQAGKGKMKGGAMLGPGRKDFSKDIPIELTEGYHTIVFEYSNGVEDASTVKLSYLKKEANE